MKTRLSVSFFILLLVSGLLSMPKSGYSQRASSRNNDVAIDFVDYLVWNTFTGQLELKLNPTSSLLLRAEYVLKNTITSATNGKTTAFGFGAAYRFYIIDSRALAGFSAAPAVDVFFFKNLIRNNILFSIGGDAAYKVFFDQFTIEPTLGARFGITPGGQLPDGESTFTGVYPVVNIYLGWAW
jgi:hypothetical protein